MSHNNCPQIYRLVYQSNGYISKILSHNSRHRSDGQDHIVTSNAFFTQWRSTMPLYLLFSCLKSRYLQQNPQVISPFLIFFLSIYFTLLAMDAETFTQQNLLKNPEKEICAFDNADIAALRASGAFPDNTVFRPFDRSIRSDVSSTEWVCFPAYPFSLGLRYPFPEFMMQFFRTTGISFAQTMPMVWRVLIVLNQIKNLHCSDLRIEDLPIAYRLRSHGSSRFLLFSTSSKPLILKATKNEDGWQRKFFFVKRDSIAEGASLPVEWLTTGRIINILIDHLIVIFY
ncbi:hypothetical protein HanPI659440_Chr13g0500681 [Helianthus annuus]|nr:hypothetical protein HanPI659440_Chr13g0500681 [Helianthus annuus]